MSSKGDESDHSSASEPAEFGTQVTLYTKVLFGNVVVVKVKPANAHGDLGGSLLVEIGCFLDCLFLGVWCAPFVTRLYMAESCNFCSCLRFAAYAFLRC